MVDVQTFDLKVGDLIQYSMDIRCKNFAVVTEDTTLYSTNNTDFSVDRDFNLKSSNGISILPLSDELPKLIRMLDNSIDSVYRDGREIFQSVRVRTTIR